MSNIFYSGTFEKQDLGCKICLQALETQLSKVEEEKLKLLVEVSEYKATVQTLKEELNESQHKVTHLTKEKTSLQELLKSEELIREKVMKGYLYLRHNVYIP